MPSTSRNRVGRSLEFLSVALDDFILRGAVPKLPTGVDWVSLLTGDDQTAQQPNAPARGHDVRWQLRLLLEPAGAYGYLCEDDLTGTAIRLAGEMKLVAVRWSDGDPFVGEDADRALESCERLLRALGAGEQAESVRALGEESPLELPEERPSVAAESLVDDPVLRETMPEPVSIVDHVAKPN